MDQQWKCSNGHDNPMTNAFCGVCGTKRPEEKMDPGMLEQLKRAFLALFPEWRDVIWSELIDKIQKTPERPEFEQLKQRVATLEAEVRRLQPQQVIVTEPPAQAGASTVPEPRKRSLVDGLLGR